MVCVSLRDQRMGRVLHTATQEMAEILARRGGSNTLRTSLTRLMRDRWISSGRRADCY